MAMRLILRPRGALMRGACLDLWPDALEKLLEYTSRCFDLTTSSVILVPIFGRPLNLWASSVD
jgi:hypothetical protein